MFGWETVLGRSLSREPAFLGDATSQGSLEYRGSNVLLCLEGNHHEDNNAVSWELKKKRKSGLHCKGIMMLHVEGCFEHWTTSKQAERKNIKAGKAWHSICFSYLKCNLGVLKYLVRCQIQYWQRGYWVSWVISWREPMDLSASQCSGWQGHASVLKRIDPLPSD